MPPSEDGGRTEQVAAIGLIRGFRESGGEQCDGLRVGHDLVGSMPRPRIDQTSDPRKGSGERIGADAKMHPPHFASL
jgi:hypothetical protein